MPPAESHTETSSGCVFSKGQCRWPMYTWYPRKGNISFYFLNNKFLSLPAFSIHLILSSLNPGDLTFIQSL